MSDSIANLMPDFSKIPKKKMFCFVPLYFVFSFWRKSVTGWSNCKISTFKSRPQLSKKNGVITPGSCLCLKQGCSCQSTVYYRSVSPCLRLKNTHSVQRWTASDKLSSIPLSAIHIDIKFTKSERGRITYVISSCCELLSNVRTWTSDTDTLKFKKTSNIFLCQSTRFCYWNNIFRIEIMSY